MPLSSIVLNSSDLAKYACMNPFCTDGEAEAQFWATNPSLSLSMRGKKEKKHDSSVSKLVCSMGDEQREHICRAMSIKREELEREERRKVEEKRGREEEKKEKTEEEEETRRLEVEKEVVFQTGRAIAREVASKIVLPASEAEKNSELTRILETLEGDAKENKEEEERKEEEQERREEEELGEEERLARKLEREEKKRAGTECLNLLSSAVESDARMRRGTKREADSLDRFQLERNVSVERRNSKKMEKELFFFRLEDGNKFVEVREEEEVEDQIFSVRLVGMVDGVVAETGEVVEAKERRKRLFRRVVDYEKVQVHCYMFLSGTRSSILRERFDSVSMDHKVLFDDSFWEECMSRVKLFLQGLLLLQSSD